MIQTTQSRIEQILSLDLSSLKFGRHLEITLTLDQLRQLLNEELFYKDGAVNAQPSLQNFLDFGNSLTTFLEDNIELQLHFSARIDRSLDELQMSICQFDLHHVENGIAIDRAIEILPIISDFVFRHRADEFIMTNQRFYAWWD